MVRQPTAFFFQEGPQAVILLHAYSGSSNDVRLLARFLQRHNYSVYAPIFTGHATSDPRDILTEGSVQRWWQDTLAAINHVSQAGFSEIAIFGLSLGSIFAAKALEERSDLAGGGVFASPIASNNETNVPTQFPRMAKKVYQQQQLATVEIATNLAWIKQQLPAQLEAINQFNRVVEANLIKIKRPFFIAQGGKDEMINPKSGIRLAQRLHQQGKITDYHFYDDASHVLTVNSAHQQLEQDLLSYLTTIF